MPVSFSDIADRFVPKVLRRLLFPTKPEEMAELEGWFLPLTRRLNMSVSKQEDLVSAIAPALCRCISLELNAFLRVFNELDEHLDPVLQTPENAAAKVRVLEAYLLLQPIRDLRPDRITPVVLESFMLWAHFGATSNEFLVASARVLAATTDRAYWTLLQALAPWGTRWLDAFPLIGHAFSQDLTSGDEFTALAAAERIVNWPIA